MKKLGLISFIRNESYFIEEWLWFHYYSGIEKFYIVLNRTTDNTLEKIRSLPFEKDIIVHKIDNITQVEAYRFLMDKYKDQVEWMLLADSDEFVFNHDGTDLKVILEEFDVLDCGGVILPWTSFGLCGYVDYPPKLLIDHQVLCDNNKSESRIKAIVKTDYYTGCDCQHFFNVSKQYVYQDGELWDNYGSVETQRIINDKIKCHHYCARGMRHFSDRYEYKKDHPEYDYNIWNSLEQSNNWSIANEDATIYSPQIRRAMKIPTYDITDVNTTFISVADYPNPEESCYSLINSARYHGVDIHWASWGQKWNSFIESKIYKIVKELTYQKSIGKKYAFVLDGCDAIINNSLRKIIDKFRLIYKGGVLFNCDYQNVMFPCDDQTIKWYITSNYGQNGIANAGCYCGSIDDIISLLSRLIEIRSCILKKNFDTFILKVFENSSSFGKEYDNCDSTGRLIDDDQWLLHLAQVEYNDLIQVDSHKRMFAMIDRYNDEDTSVFNSDSRGSAVILHCPHIQKDRDTHLENKNWKEIVKQILK